MTSTILNIILQLIESAIIFYFFESTSKHNQQKITKFTIVSVCYLIMCILNIAFKYNLVINNISLLAFQFLFSYCIYKNNVKVSILYSILITGLICSTEFITISLLTTLFKVNSYDFLRDTTQYIMVIIISKSLLFILLKVVSEIIGIQNQQKFNYVYYIYPISALIVFLDFALMLNKTNLIYSLKIILSISSIVVLISVIVFCIFQQQTVKKEQRLIELQSIQQKQEIENTYFNLLEHQNEELQIFVHDIKKHLDNIYNLSNDSYKTQEYIKDLSKDLYDSNIVGKTSNKLLDLIIDKYSFLSKEKQLNFELEIHSSDLSFLKDTDLTSIFNNLLDNALEAAEKSYRKLIVLSINSFGKILTISLSNSCDVAPISKQHILLSTKSENGIHGYGFKSVNKAVKKYNGDLEWDYNESEQLFNVSIIFPQK